MLSQQPYWLLLLLIVATIGTLYNMPTADYRLVLVAIRPLFPGEFLIIL